MDYGYNLPWDVLLTIPNLRDLRVKLLPPYLPESTGYWTDYEGIWLVHLKRFKGLRIFEVYIPLPRTAQLPEGIDVGSCQLYATDFYGTPYRGEIEEEPPQCPERLGTWF